MTVFKTFLLKKSRKKTEEKQKKLRHRNRYQNLPKPGFGRTLAHRDENQFQFRCLW